MQKPKTIFTYLSLTLLPLLLFAQRGPDLVITDLRVKEVNRNTIIYSYQVNNEGNETVELGFDTPNDKDDVVIRTVISQDNKLDEGDVPVGELVLGSLQQTSLGPRESIKGEIKFDAEKDPADFSYLVMRVDDGEAIKESDEDNNIRAVPIFCPDLFVKSLEVEPIGNGQAEFTFVIENTGNIDVDLQDSYIQVYASADQGISIFSDKSLIDFSYGEKIIVKASDTFTDTQIGDYDFSRKEMPYVIIEVDGENNIDECDEENNEKVIDLSCPDLEISNLILQQVDEINEIQFTLKNTGNAPFPLENAYLTMRASAEEAGTNSISLALYRGDTLQLAPGDSVVERFTLAPTFPFASFPYFVIEAFNTGDLEECETGNNTDVIMVTCPDLIVSDLAATRTVNGVSYSFEIKNVGTAVANLAGGADGPAGDVAIQAMVSDDEIFDNEGDIPAGGIVIGPSVPTLNPGETYSRNFQGSPNFRVSEKPYLVLKVDHRNDLNEECNETNNTFAIPIDCPDLIVKSLRVTGVSNNNDSPSISYAFTIQNIGTAPAELGGATGGIADGISVQAFTSSNDQFNDDGDWPAGGKKLGTTTLLPGDSLEQSFSSGFRYELDTQPYLTMMVDWGNRLDECDEDNNTFAHKYACPDLSINDLTITKRDGTGFGFRYVLENRGLTKAIFTEEGDIGSPLLGVQSYLSIDDILGNDDDQTAGGAFLRGSLEPGGTIDEELFFEDIPFNVDTYKFFFLTIFFKDQFDGFEDLDTTNNTFMVPVEEPTSIQEQLDPAFEIFPNPLTPNDHLTIKTHVMHYQGSIVSSDGRVLETFNERNPPRMDALSQGLYWLLIRDRQGVLKGRKALMVLP